MTNTERYPRPGDYKILRDTLKTAERTAAYGGFGWSDSIPQAFRELVEKTSPQERLEGLLMGQWPFSDQDIEIRTIKQMQVLRRERADDILLTLVSMETDDKGIRNLLVGWEFNLEEFVATEEEVEDFSDKIFYTPS